MQSDDVMGNKAELADALSMTLPTLDQYLKRNPDFPVEQRGSNGVPWVFNITKGMQFYRDQKRAAEKAERQRLAKLDHFTSGGLFTDEEDEGDGPRISYKEKLEATQLEKQRRILAREAGFLIETPKLRQGMTRAIQELSTNLMTMPALMGQRFNLPQPVVHAMTEAIEEQLRRTHEGIMEALSVDHDGEA